MAEPRFRRAIDKVAKPILEPLGFSLRIHSEPGYGGVYTFLRSWKAGYMQAIGLYTSRNSRAFTVELGVLPGNFDISVAVSETSPTFRELGVRERLGKIVSTPGLHVDSFHRDFLEYKDQASLEDALRRTIEQAIYHGPEVWERMGRRLLEKE